MAASGKVGRNDRCPCGSGKKYKHCCEQKKGGLTPVGWLTVAMLTAALGVLVYFVLGAASSDRPLAGRCPAGQVWSAEHGHCH